MLQVPPETVLLSVIVAPMQMGMFPVIGPGAGEINTNAVPEIVPEIVLHRVPDTDAAVTE
jgi:hypothetical protein